MEKLGINVTWLLAQLVNISLLIFILWMFAYKPVLKLMNDRKQKIQESLDYAEKVKRDAAEQQKEFEQKLEQTRRETRAASAAAAQVGEKEREVILAQARQDARKLVDQAKEQIEFERKQMMSDLREEVVHLSLLAAQKVVGQSLDDAAHRKLVSEFISQTDQFGKN